MANNLEAVMPKILALASAEIRNNSTLPRLVNTDYSPNPAQKGDTVTIVKPSKLEATDVVPGPYSTNTQDVDPGSVSFKLNNWKESAFALSDAEIAAVMAGYPVRQVAEAGRAIVKAVTRSILKTSLKFPAAVGTPGTTPFATNADIASEARKILNRNEAPDTDRIMVLDVEAEANAHKLGLFQQADMEETVINGRLDRRYGFDIYRENRLQQTVIGSKAGTPLIQAVGGQGYVETSVNGEDYYTVRIDGFSAGAVINQGDIFTVAGDTTRYVALEDATVTGGVANIQFGPKPAAQFADNAAVTFAGNYTANLAFHRDAMALAVRPLVADEFELELGGRAMTMVDPVTGFPLRLEVRREHKRVRYSVDALWGTGILEKDWGVKILG